MENIEVKTQDQKEKTVKEPIVIPFGGRVCLGTGMFVDEEGKTYGGALDIGWLDHREDVGKWLDESVVKTVTPIVRCAFPDMDSVDAMVKQLMLLEFFFAKGQTGDCASASKEVFDRFRASYDDAMEQINSIDNERIEKPDDNG